MTTELTTNIKKMSLLDKEQFNHYFDVATQLSKSTMVPKHFMNKPMDLFIAMEMGNQLGLPMMQAIQDIAVINGKPSMYGDALLATVQGHHDYEWIKEQPITDGAGEIIGYSCSIKRKNHEEHIYSFTKDDAKKAGLLGRPGPWTQYPQRMLQMRARGFGIRNIFADALRGIKPAEEVLDSHHTIEGNIVEKLTQADKMKLLLDKKGLNHEYTKKTDDNHNDSSFIDNNVQLYTTGNSIKNDAEESTLCSGLVENGESKSCITMQETLDSSCTESQLDIIDCLLHEKSFDASRINKAFKHFEVKNFSELTENQANEMIKILECIE